ncbi:MAG: Hsp20/alpha crystallin family protein [Lentisphaeria bacterium]|nr:Hsp20/alpha crystallin family protein [Lentisphaeria bacterium]
MLNNHKKHSFLPAVRRWDSMFDSVLGKLDFFNGEEMRSELDDYIAPDMIVTDNAITVHIALPGFCRENIHVEIENDFLNVRSEHTDGGHCHCKGKKILRSERMHNEYFQSVRLPGNIKSQEASAIYKDGILTISIPRENCSCKSTSKIEVK